MERFTFFWRATSPFSQWHHSTFTVDGITYNCAEQFMMYQKAILFGDKEIAQKILKESLPMKQKYLGRKVRNFDEQVWEKHCRDIVYKGNYAKFTQNKHLLKKLLETAGTTLVEASPYDTIWGIGLDETHPHAKDRSKWRGENRLGEILTRLREDLIKKGYRA
jgi:ribA/ribD-fused uncharacterized protein